MLNWPWSGDSRAGNDVSASTGSILSPELSDTGELTQSLRP
jgi:hypothetical protein